MFTKMLQLLGAMTLLILLADVLDRLIRLESLVDQNDENLAAHMETDDRPHAQYENRDHG